MLTAALPTGTVTFVFTDIEGSTRLWEQSPDAMNMAIARHDELLEEVVAEHDGYVFARAGDGWGIAFASSGRAVRAALEIQRRMAREPWPASLGDLRLRVGAHAGTANQRDGDFFGTAVNRAARVAAAAHGGQIFLTDAVHALIADEPESDWRLHDLGEHRLRDLTRPEHIWQIDAPDATAPIADFRPRKLAGNLPKAGAAVIGRESLLGALLGDLSESNLVTLVGVGGVGKTTVAVEAARRLAAESGIGAWFVDLTTVADPRDVASSVAAALGVAKRRDMSGVDGLIDGLQAGEWIIVIDNAEHLVDGVASVVDHIARRVATAKLIVTSREPLSISSETVQRVPPLGAAQTESSPAAQLFVERAMAAAPDLTPQAFPRDVVSRICDWLDGLPLAIELAAAHAETMTPAEILSALESGSLALRSESRSASARHRSIEDLVAWSYDRLDDDAKRVFERLSIFVGGAVAEAALEVCGEVDLDEPSVRSALRKLVRKSLVAPERSGEATRFTMLETLRRYAEQRCREEPSNASAEARHAGWFGTFARDAAAGMQSPSEAQWQQRIVREADNMERAARWAAENEATDALGELGACLPPLLESNMLPGVEAWINLALDTLPTDHPGRLHYAYAASYLALFGGDIHGWRDGFESATADLKTHPRVMAARDAFGLISAFFIGDIETVRQATPAALEALYDQGDQRTAGSLEVDLGLAHLFTDHIGEARRVADEFHQRAVAGGIPSVLAWSLYLLGEVSAGSDPDMAVHHFEESVENAVAVGGHFVAGLSLIAMAATAARNDDTSTAIDAMYRAVRLWYAAGNRPQFWTAIRNLVQILHRLGQNEEAYRLQLATEAAADKAPELFGPYGDLHRQVVAEIEASLPDSERTAIQRSSDLDYAATATFAIELLENLID